MTTTQENSNTEATAPNDTEETQTKAKSKAYQRQNIAQRLVINKRALDNIRSSPEIAGQLAVFGYTPEKINSFEKLYNEAVEANSHQQKEFGEKAEAYAEFERLFSVSKKNYSGAVSIAKIAFKRQPEKLTRLGADQAKKQTISGLIDQIQTFYDNALADESVLQAMSVYSYDHKKLSGFKGDFLNAVSAYSNFYRENTEAVLATKSRDEKIEALDEFYSDLITISKIAFANNSQMLKEIA